MVKINGFIFLGIGLLLSIISTYVNKVQNSNSLAIFVYIGYGFIAYGAAKILINYIIKKESKKEEKDLGLNENFKEIKSPFNNKQQFNTKGINHHMQVDQKNELYGYIGKCPTCGTPMRKINIYCHRCGRKQIITNFSKKI